MKLGAGYPMGPLELADYVGLDTAAVQVHLRRVAQGAPRRSALQAQHTQAGQPGCCCAVSEHTGGWQVKAGKMGRKSGEGFYKYEAPAAKKPRALACSC
eukprot:TRINITY_DN110_c0_g3_i10.p2 TRINITY_DN110_c0_g3~~TRINITY_DN110_c0_g3_i10.p2  ORF type:complete len:115 (+),score=0.92 TRINITY_DN110_c0_g3_i10:50-346(+)